MENQYFTDFFKLLFKNNPDISVVFCEFEVSTHSKPTQHYSVCLWLHVNVKGSSYAVFGWQYNLKDYTKFDIVTILEYLQNQNATALKLNLFPADILPQFFDYIKTKPFDQTTVL